MKKYGAVAMLVFLCATQAAMAQTGSRQEINLNQSLVLNAKQQQALAVEAMRGSTEAATKLFLFYGFVALNPTEEHRWVVVGAENGDPVAQYNLYKDLINSDDDLDKLRAEFWLKKAAAAGDSRAKSELQDLEKVQHAK
jgi:TPR repeat protein